ncbi:hypothetical protein GF407_19185 [candidate division KSB1 bacterium]|nr:hypothetical protein [candidate division KSB1 bacterium]
MHGNHPPQISFFEAMGVWAWIMVPLALITLYFIIKRTIDVLHDREKTVSECYRELHTVLFWGSLTAVFGLLGQIMGLWNAIFTIIRATDINPQIVMKGFRISFYPTIFGLITLVVAAIAWYGLTIVLRKRKGADA